MAGPGANWLGPAGAQQVNTLFGNIRPLIAAATQDNVPGEAIKALVGLGSEIIVSDNLISDAIKALNGSEDIRILDAKATIGLRNGVTIAQFRGSTPCIKGFLLVTALEACGYDNAAIGDVLYEMLSCRDLLQTYPTSTDQLQALHNCKSCDLKEGEVKIFYHNANQTAVLSGHCKALTWASGDDATHEILEALAMNTTSGATQALPRECWERLDKKAFAKILSLCFDAIRDKDISHIELTGCYGLIDVLRCVFWLNKEEVALLHNNVWILGEEQRKIWIRPSISTTLEDQKAGHAGSSTTHWGAKVWKEGRPIPSLIGAGDGRVPESSDHTIISAASTYNFCRSLAQSQEAMDLLGIVASAYVQASLASDVDVTDGGVSMTQKLVTFISIPHFHEAPTTTHIPILEKLGWPSAPESQSEEARLVHAGIVDCMLKTCTKHDNFNSHLEELYNGLVAEHRLGNFQHFRRVAMSIAGHALLYLFIRIYPTWTNDECKEVAGLQPLQHFDLQRDFSRFELLVNQTGSRLEIGSLRNAIFRTALGSTPRAKPYEVPLALSASGWTGFLAPISHHAIRKEGLFDLHLVPGLIWFERTSVTTVFESDRDGWDQPTPPHVQGGKWKLSYKLRRDNSNLVMTTIMKTGLDSRQYTVHYSRCIERIATSLAITRSLSEEFDARSSPNGQIHDETDISQATKRRVWNVMDPLLRLALQSHTMSSPRPTYVEVDPSSSPLFQVQSNSFLGELGVTFFGALSLYLPPNCVFVLQGQASLEHCHRIALEHVLFTKARVRKIQTQVEETDSRTPVSHSTIETHEQQADDLADISINRMDCWRVMCRVD